MQCKQGSSIYLLNFLLLVSISTSAFAQTVFPDSANALTRKLQSHSDAISRDLTITSNHITKATEKLKSRVEKLERKLGNLLTDSNKLNQFNLNNSSGLINGVEKFGNSYHGNFDSLKVSASFIQSKELVEKLNDFQQQINEASHLDKILVSRVKEISQIQVLLKSKRELLKYQQAIFSYRQEISRYKKLVDDPSKSIQKLIEFARTKPAFEKYFAKYSIIGQLFPSNDESVDSSGFGTLQTSAEVSKNLESKLGNKTSIGSIIQQNQVPHTIDIEKMIPKLATAEFGDDINQPNFKGNNQKSKKFTERLVVGANLQSTRSSTYLPSTTDFAGSLGYSLTDKSIIGIGASYLLGWGDFRAIKLTHQGLGFRTFIDYKIKNQFWLTGGGETNYREIIQDFDALRNTSKWQKLVLIGVTKKIKVKKMNSKIQLLFNLLHKESIPVTQPILFRVGWDFSK